MYEIEYLFRMRKEITRNCRFITLTGTTNITSPEKNA